MSNQEFLRKMLVGQPYSEQLVDRYGESWPGLYPVVVQGIIIDIVDADLIASRWRDHPIVNDRFVDGNPVTTAREFVTDNYDGDLDTGLTHLANYLDRDPDYYLSFPDRALLDWDGQPLVWNVNEPAGFQAYVDARETL